jgi:hypothetical protein
MLDREHAFHIGREERFGAYPERVSDRDSFGAVSISGRSEHFSRATDGPRVSIAHTIGS